MYVPRRWVSRTASRSESAPAATSADHSPREWPATSSNVRPLSMSARNTAIDVVRIAGCVNLVSVSSSSGPSKHSFDSANPSTSSASS